MVITKWFLLFPTCERKLDPYTEVLNWWSVFKNNFLLLASLEPTPQWSSRASSDTVSFTFTYYHTWQFIIFTIFTITIFIFPHSFSISFWTQDLALRQILSSINLFLSLPGWFHGLSDHNCRKPCLKTLAKPFEFGFRSGECRFRSRFRSSIHNEEAQAAAAARWRNTTHYQLLLYGRAARGPSFPVSTLLLIYKYSLLPARAVSKTLLFVLWLLRLQTGVKERCGSSRWLSNLQRCYDNCIADVSKIIYDSRKYCFTTLILWERASALQFYCSSSFR